MVSSSAGAGCEAMALSRSMFEDRSAGRVVGVAERVARVNVTRTPGPRLLGRARVGHLVEESLQGACLSSLKDRGLSLVDCTLEDEL